MLFRKAKEKKEKNTGYSSILEEKYMPVSLPEYGLGLDHIIVSDYKLNDEEYLRSLHEKLEKQMQAVIDTTDTYTDETVSDSIVEAQMAFIRAGYEREKGVHEDQIQKILHSRSVRQDHLTREKECSEAKIAGLKEQIRPLRDARPKYEICLGKNIRFHLGIPVTLLALIVDSFINYFFLEQVIYQSVPMMIMTVIALALMSDGSMTILGTLFSSKKEDRGNQFLHWTFVSLFLLLFLISIAASIMTRFGSMNLSFGSISMSGEWIAKKSFSIAELGVTMVCSLVTTVTGLMSFAFSYDPAYSDTKYRRSLEFNLKTEQERTGQMADEQAALRLAEDPTILDEARKLSAEKNISTLTISLKLHIRRLLIEKHADAEYTDKLTLSEKSLLEEIQTQQSERKKFPREIRSELKEAI